MSKTKKQTITRSDYERVFKDYPDVVNLEQFRQMLGGISEIVARHLMQDNAVERFIINETYYIPKVRVIDFVMSSQYESLKKRLKHQIKVRHKE